MEASGHFNLEATMQAVWHAFVNVICRIGFDAAVHGLIVAFIVLAVGIGLSARKHRFGKPFISVFRKIAIFCSLLVLPGLICFVSAGKLPPVNSLQLSSFGLIGFWALVTLHLLMEEINFQLFEPKQSSSSQL